MQLVCFCMDTFYWSVWYTPCKVNYYWPPEHARGGRDSWSWGKDLEGEKFWLSQSRDRLKADAFCFVEGETREKPSGVGATEHGSSEERTVSTSAYEPRPSEIWGQRPVCWSGSCDRGLSSRSGPGRAEWAGSGEDRHSHRSISAYSMFWKWISTFSIFCKT